MLLSIQFYLLYVSFCSVRTWTSQFMLPKIMLIYLVLFNTYCANYPYGFQYVAFLGTFLLVQHAMFVLFYRFEIPAFENGSINALTPRQWIQIEIYENVQEGDAEEEEETVWHTGGVRRRRHSDASLHHNTVIAGGGISTSTIVLGKGSKVELLQAPKGMILNSAGDNSGFIQNSALSRRIQYEQMASLIGRNVMESSGAATTYYKSGPSDATLSSPGAKSTDKENANDHVMSWTRDILSTLGLDFSLMGAVGRNVQPSTKSGVSSINADLNAEVDTKTSTSSSKLSNKPDSGISKYDLTGYVPTATTRRTRSSTRTAVPERPFPPRDVPANAGAGAGSGSKLKRNSSRSDFGYDKSGVKYQVFGLDEE